MPFIRFATGLIGLTLMISSAHAQSRDSLRKEMNQTILQYAQDMGALELVGRACGLKSAENLKADVLGLAIKYYDDAAVRRILAAYDAEQERRGNGRLTKCDPKMVETLMSLADRAVNDINALARKLK